MTAGRMLYLDFAPRETGFRDIGNGPSLYWECSGTPGGKPVVFLHGRAGGSSPDHRRQFDPDIQRAERYAQRDRGSDGWHGLRLARLPS